MMPMATAAASGLEELLAIAACGRVAWQRSCLCPRIGGWQFDGDVRGGVVPMAPSGGTGGGTDPPVEIWRRAYQGGDHEPRGFGACAVRVSPYLRLWRSR